MDMDVSEDYLDMLQNTAEEIEDECDAIRKKCNNSNSVAPLRKWFEKRVKRSDLVGYINDLELEGDSDYHVRLVLHPKKGAKKNHKIILIRDFHGDVVRL